MAPNLALVSIPAYWLLTLLPHSYAVSIASQGNLAKYDNRNPRGAGMSDNLRKALGQPLFERWERSEAAHRNGLESIPLYVAAVFAGLLAEGAGKLKLQGTGGMDKFVYSWFAVRILYTVVYIRTSDPKKTLLRTILYLVGVGLCTQQIVRAANVIGA